MKTKIFLLGAATLLLSACQEELQQLDNQALCGRDNTDLSINVVTENIESKGLVSGNYLDSGEAIGVTVTNTSGGNYDNTAYNKAIRNFRLKLASIPRKRESLIS